MVPLFFQMQNSLLFFGNFKCMQPDESEKLDSAFLGYMFKDFCSVYGV